MAAAARTLQHSSRTVLPLGMAKPELQAYKLIKLSQFLFRTARQKERIKREWDALVNGNGVRAGNPRHANDVQ